MRILYIYSKLNELSLRVVEIFYINYYVYETLIYCRFPARQTAREWPHEPGPGTSGASIRCSPSATWPRGTRAKGLRDRDGVAAVEFTFSLPFLLLLFSGIVQFGSIMFLENHMTNVVRETSRRIAVGEPSQADAVTMCQES